VVSRKPTLKFLSIVLIAIATGAILNGNEPGSKGVWAVENRDFSGSLAQPLLQRIDRLARSMKQDPKTQQEIATLVNGNYQFCTEPPPSDWRSGAGVCFYFTKIGDRVSGYYGYPYTDELICLRGKVNSNLVIGEALMISWLGREWTSIPKTAFKWDEEGRLTLKGGKIIHTAIDGGGRTDWILFRSAVLDTKGFYRSNNLPLTPPAQLCNWK
jgi:hypothetical protein